MNKRGITSFGAYVPRRRLPRGTIAAAHGWANPNLSGLARGHRAFCGHDEDSLTMAAVAGRRALSQAPPPSRLLLASTTLPFADRHNATLVGEALGLPPDLAAMDCGGGLRAGVSALRLALEGDISTLVLATDKRATRPGSTAELRIGDAAAAFAVGEGPILAELIGAHAVSVDFVDHYRMTDSRFDYQLEERWVRDEGLVAIVPPAIRSLLERTGVDAARIDRFICGGLSRADAVSVAAACGIDAGAAVPDLHAECGDSGTAHPLLLLTQTLADAAPGQFILVVGLGQGAELLLLRTTDDVCRASAMTGAAGALAGGVVDDNYLRYLSFNDHLQMDWGMRAERDLRTAQSAFFRHRDTVTRLVGGRCTACGTPQFPRARLCVNPACGARDTQVPEPFADKQASVKSFTEDWLAHCTNPPLLYGNIRFEGGGVAMLEFSDFAPGELSVGAPLEMQFRIKDFDVRRNFRRYCWKAVPAGVREQGNDNG